MRTVLIASALMFGVAGMANAATPAQPASAPLPVCSKTVKDHCTDAHAAKGSAHKSNAKTANTTQKSPARE
ncbi:hypothetical protein [Sphingosinicella microcystinivorans]|nr:hypothetical protein [Sphingosinicella microcystinivorans]